MENGRKKIDVETPVLSSESANPYSLIPNPCGAFSLIEALLVMSILFALLVPTALVYSRYRQGLLLDTTAQEVSAALQMARDYAVNERRESIVRFADDGYTVYRDGANGLGRYYAFPEHVTVGEKTGGVDPVVFLPDGSARQAGHLVLCESRTRKTRRITIHNLTGKCVLE